MDRNSKFSVLNSEFPPDHSGVDRDISKLKIQNSKFSTVVQYSQNGGTMICPVKGAAS